MIEIAPDTACLLYLALALSIVLIIWYLQKKKEVSHFERHARRCEFCQMHYLEDEKSLISRCPHCQLLNKSR